MPANKLIQDALVKLLTEAGVPESVFVDNIAAMLGGRLSDVENFNRYFTNHHLTGELDEREAMYLFHV